MGNRWAKPSLLVKELTPDQTTENALSSMVHYFEKSQLDFKIIVTLLWY